LAQERLLLVGPADPDLDLPGHLGQLRLKLWPVLVEQTGANLVCVGHHDAEAHRQHRPARERTFEHPRVEEHLLAAEPDVLTADLAHQCGGVLTADDPERTARDAAPARRGTLRFDDPVDVLRHDRQARCQLRPRLELEPEPELRERELRERDPELDPDPDPDRERRDDPLLPLSSSSSSSPEEPNSDSLAPSRTPLVLLEAPSWVMSSINCGNP